MNDINTKIKSFWERPEGTTGMITLALLGLGGFFLVNAALPFISMFLSNAIAVVGKGIALGGLLFIVAAILFVITDKRFTTLCKYMFMSAMRAVTGIVVELDPIGIMKNYIEELYKKKVSFDSNKAELKGQIRNCDLQISNNLAEIDKATRLAKQAQNAGNEGQLRVHGRNMTRLSELNDRMSATRDKMQKLYDFLCKYSEATNLVIQDMENDVLAREQERKYSTTSNNAMKSAMSIIKGEGIGRQLYDEAMEFALQDYANKMGEIEDFMIDTKSIMDGIDMQNGIWEQNALEKLTQFESKTSLLLGEEKRIVLENHSSTKNVESIKPDYQKLFNK
jgi:hypothetical protein